MKINPFQTAVLALSLLSSLDASQAQVKKGVQSAKVSFSPAAPRVGQPVTFTMITTSKAPLTGIVMMSVYDAKNKRVDSEDWQSAKLVKGGSRTFKWNWKPGAKGVYTVQSGVFGPKWKPTHYFGWRAAKFTVK